MTLLILDFSKHQVRSRLVIRYNDIVLEEQKKALRKATTLDWRMFAQKKERASLAKHSRLCPSMTPFVGQYYNEPMFILA
jgi:hypothetical protein